MLCFIFMSFYFEEMILCSETYDFLFPINFSVKRHPLEAIPTPYPGNTLSSTVRNKEFWIAVAAQLRAES